jgi:putative membrane protein
MKRFTKPFAVFVMAAGLALPASLSRAEDKVPTPPDSRTGVPGSNSNTPGGDTNQNKGPVGSTGAVNTQNATAGKVKLNSKDEQFVMDAANGGMAEVQLGQLAQEKAQSQAVKDFGKRMVDDHSKANDQLKQIIAEKGLSMPSEVKGEERAHYDKLAKLNGAEFDKAYIKLMVADHKKDIKAFEKEAKKGKDADVKAFASNTLPTLEQHDAMIKEVAANSGDKDLARLAGHKESAEKGDKSGSSTDKQK